MHLPAGSSLPQTCYRVSVKGFMFDDQNNLLIIDEGDQLYDIPGGGIDHGESATQALQREIQEEVGSPAIVADQPLFTRVRRHRNGVRYFFIGYACHIDLNTFTPSDEAQSYRRISKKDLANTTHKDDTFTSILEHFDTIYERYHNLMVI